MDKDKIKTLFHSLFNKVGTIAVGVASTENLLRKEELNTISPEELKKRIFHLLKVLNKVEENSIALNKTLEELYRELSAQEDFVPPDFT
ncbi:MAG: hypothetical protein A2166_06470 [Omnitrophica WOR_2 bacterium RBG_13_41_10]|nr:MAG: hypothetical protein A2166_06470 [Omnitrophica WOR_2 bacterium RBG_13_41_10]